MKDEEFLLNAVGLARESLALGAFPCGALVVIDDQVIAESMSMSEHSYDPTAHAEVSAIRKACQKLETQRLVEATLYSSLEPCLMCFHSAYWAGINKVTYACSKTLVNQQCYEGSTDLNSVAEFLNHQIQLKFVRGLESEVSELVQSWS